MELHNNTLETSYDYEEIETKGILEVPLGIGFYGPVNLNILKAPHVMIGGETGGGKSTVLRVILTYLLTVKAKAHDIYFHLVDLKDGIEFKMFTQTDRVKTFARSVEDTSKLLKGLLKETERRYNLFYEADVVSIEEYNKKFKKKKLSYEVAVIDEFVDLARTDCIDILNKILSKSRAAGIHIIISTQRPCAKTIDTRLRANVPSVIGLKTKDKTNSQIILDDAGLETLRGSGHAIVKAGDVNEIQCFNLTTEHAKKLLNSSYSKREEKAAFIPKTKEKKEEVKDFGFLEMLEGGKGD